MTTTQTDDRPRCPLQARTQTVCIPECTQKSDQHFQLLSLALLMLGVRLANHPNHAFALDHAAILANSFHARSNFHRSYSPANRQKRTFRRTLTENLQKPKHFARKTAPLAQKMPRYMARHRSPTRNRLLAPGIAYWLPKSPIGSPSGSPAHPPSSRCCAQNGPQNCYLSSQSPRHPNPHT